MQYTNLFSCRRFRAGQACVFGAFGAGLSGPPVLPSFRRDAKQERHVEGLQQNCPTAAGGDMLHRQRGHSPQRAQELHFK